MSKLNDIIVNDKKEIKAIRAKFPGITRGKMTIFQAFSESIPKPSKVSQLDNKTMPSTTVLEQSQKSFDIPEIYFLKHLTGGNSNEVQNTDVGSEEERKSELKADD